MGLGESTLSFMRAALIIRSALSRASSRLFMADTMSCCTRSTRGMVPVYAGAARPAQMLGKSQFRQFVHGTFRRDWNFSARLPLPAGLGLAPDSGCNEDVSAFSRDGLVWGS